MSNRIMTGCIERVRWNQNYAVVLILDLNNLQLSATFECGPRFIAAGETRPVFTNFLKNPSISPGDMIVAEVGELGGVKKIVAWGFEMYWKKAEAEISRRPVFRVIRENRFKGQIMKAGVREEVVFEGSLKRLVTEHPRDGLRVSTGDRFAPAYRTGPVTAINRFVVKQNGLDWAPCEDPRPFPDGPIFRMMFRSQTGKIRQLASGTALQIDSLFQRGVDHPLVSETGGYLYFERFDVDAPEGKQWTECNDPRPFPEVSATATTTEATSATATAASATKPTNSNGKPLVMPKKPKGPFSTTLHSLEDLTVV